MNCRAIKQIIFISQKELKNGYSQRLIFFVLIAYILTIFIN